MIAVTVNLGNKSHNVTAGQQRRRLRDIAAAGPAVIAVQEAHPRLKAPKGYRIVRYGHGGAHANPFLVAKTRRVVGMGAERVHEGKAGAWPARWITWVQLEAPYGNTDRVTFLNVHVNSRIDAAGRPRRPYPSARLHGARTNIRRARRLANRFDMDGPVIVLGDWNIDSRADQRRRYKGFPVAQLHRADFREHPATLSLPGTLGGRRVDRVFTSPDVRGHTARLLAKVPRFDHRPVLVTFSLKGRP